MARRSRDPGQVRTRVRWLDVLRGAGIVLVVAGHVTTDPTLCQAIFLFHMPMFFFLSGYLYRPEAPGTLIARRSRTLLLPYACFMLMFVFLFAIAGWASSSFSLDSFLSFAGSVAYGGSALGGMLAVAWFVPCLFWTNILYAMCAQRFGGPARPAMITMAVLAHAVAYVVPPLSTPLGIGQVPFALTIFWAGAFFRQLPAPRHLWMPCIVGFACAVFWGQSLDMRAMMLGFPGASLVIALCAIIPLIRTAERVAHWQFLAPLLSRLGQAAIVILFLHMAVMTAIGDLLPESLTFAVALVGPYLVYCLLRGARWSSELFLGQRQALSK